MAKEASFASMDADGFTVNWTKIDSVASQIFSLALSGVPAPKDVDGRKETALASTT